MNGACVLEIGHNDVVHLIQSLPLDFRLVVARRPDGVQVEQPVTQEEQAEAASAFTGEPTISALRGHILKDSM